MIGFKPRRLFKVFCKNRIIFHLVSSVYWKYLFVKTKYVLNACIYGVEYQTSYLISKQWESREIFLLKQETNLSYL